jgi:Delta7-sterol 5-desaturase
MDRLLGDQKLMNHSFVFYSFVFFLIILARYFILAGGVHLLLDGISDNPLAMLSTRSDMRLSVISSIIFALGAAVIMSAYDLGLTCLYANIHQYPLWYLGFSYIAVILLQDTYFYFLHRFFHRPSLFHWWHEGHHRSRYPTPWTSFAFDLLESFAHLLFLIAVVFVIPLHFTTLVAVLSTMTAWAIVNHLELDGLPTGFPHHWCGRWFTGPAHHGIHHRQYTVHYGLYFTFWDRQLGTQSPNYDQEVTNITD